MLISGNKAAVFKYLLLLVVILLMYLPSYISQDWLIAVTEEDGIYEYAGALFFFLGAVVFSILVFKPNAYPANHNNSNSKGKWYFAVLAIVLFVAFGEEISWGQRIFDFATPETVKKLNVQNEFNLHNLEIFHGEWLNGEDKTGIAALFEIHKLFYLSFLAYLFVLPLIFQLSNKFKRFIHKTGIPVPSIYLGLLLLFNLIYGHILRAVIGGPTNITGHAIVEIKEVAVALILFALPLTMLKYPLSVKKSYSLNN
jgi:hypothetical protein